MAYVDLITNEFKYKRISYRNFTSDYFSISASSSKSQEEIATKTIKEILRNSKDLFLETC